MRPRTEACIGGDGTPGAGDFRVQRSDSRAPALARRRKQGISRPEREADDYRYTANISSCLIFISMPPALDAEPLGGPSRAALGGGLAARWKRNVKGNVVLQRQRARRDAGGNEEDENERRGADLPLRIGIYFDTSWKIQATSSSLRVRCPGTASSAA
jgi:hypothetical protein